MNALRSARVACLAAITTLLVAPAAIAAQAAAAAQQSKLPIDEGMPQVRLPHAKEATLKNGLRVFVLEGAGQIPTFTARMIFTDAGGLYEPAGRRGLANFTAELLREGTATRTSEEIARQFETLGATLESEAPLASTFGSVTTTGLSTHLAPVLRLLADVIRNPTFPEAEVKQYASRTLADLEVQRARPEFLSQELLLKALYRNHPAALAAPPIEDIKATRAADLRHFHAEHYAPDTALLVVVGDVKLDAVLPVVEREFGRWQAPMTRSHTELPVLPEPARRAVHLEDRPGSVQTVLQLGVLGIARTDRDYIAVQVMNEILGGKASSRLFQNLREKNGYTYGAYSGFSATAIPGVWQISTSVRTEVTAGALQELFAEMERMRREPVSDVELVSAKRGLIGKYIFSLERPDVLLDNVATRLLYGLPADYWDTYAQNVQAVTAQDVKRVAERIITLDQLQIAAVGDAGKVRDAFARYESVAHPDEPASGPGRGEPTGRVQFSDDEQALLRRTIAAIADELLSLAVEKSADAIGWTTTDEQGKPQQSVNFYDGNSGIGYFLLKAGQALGEEKYRQAAQRSFDYLLSQSKSDAHGRFFDPTGNGVFVGNAGPAYALLYAHHVTGKQGYLQAAEEIARRIVAVPDVGPASSPDIISGAAGTGLFLLKMNDATGNHLYLDGAKRLGDFLVEQAEHRTDGATWKLRAEGQEYYFVGFSHGPAGIGYYLDRLYGATSDERYRVAAHQALSHIEAIALHEGDWVKWYHEQLRRADRYPSQWCHGAPGMNPFFLEMYRRDAEQDILRWARLNTRYLINQGVDVRHNGSVCHGISGNVASLYQMYRLTTDDDYLAAVKSGLDRLYERLGVGSANPVWRHPSSEIDPTYMTGLAGVGDLLISLYTQGKLNMFGPLGYGDDL